MRSKIIDQDSSCMTVLASRSVRPSVPRMASDGPHCADVNTVFTGETRGSHLSDIVVAALAKVAVFRMAELVVRLMLEKEAEFLR